MPPAPPEFSSSPRQPHWLLVTLDEQHLAIGADAVEAVFTVAMASQIDGIEAVVFTGERSAKTDVIRDFAPLAAIFFANDGAVPDKIA